MTTCPELNSENRETEEDGNGRSSVIIEIGDENLVQRTGPTAADTEKETNRLTNNGSTTETLLNLHDLSPEAQEFQKAQRSDRDLKDLWESVEDQDSRYEEINGFLYKRSHTKDNESRLRLVVPQQYKNQLLKLAHDSLWSAHRGIHATKSKLWDDFTWTGMDADIKDYIRTCEQCQKNCDYTKITQGTTGGNTNNRNGFPYLSL